MKITKMLTSVNRTKMSGKKNKYTVIHYTGNYTDKAVSNARYFEDENRGASAHYFVDDTDIYQVVEDSDAAWAVGRNYGSNNLFGTVTNKNSISIEMCSKNGVITDKTFSKTVDLCKHIMKKYGIPASHVYRHYDVCSKECPGWYGWLPPNESIWKKFKKAIGGKVSESKDTKSGSFLVKVKVNDLNVRTGPGTSYKSVDKVNKGDVFTIVDTEGSWGKLKSGAGWINISSKYTTRV